MGPSLEYCPNDDSRKKNENPIKTRLLKYGMKNEP